MGARRLAGAVLLTFAVALLAAAAPALADEQLTPNGSLVFAWHGDPARGCAAIGVCGVAGTLIVRPADDVTFMSAGGGHGELVFESVAATVRVTGAGPGVCVDQGSDGDFGAPITVGLTRGGVARLGSGPLSAGRCAGPTENGLAGLRLAAHRTGTRHPSFDLNGGVAFSSGPYSGTLTARLRLLPDRTGGYASGSSSSSGRSGLSIPPARQRLVEQVTLAYRFAAPGSTLGVPFTGEPDPFCAALDACGASGSLALSLPASHGRVTLVFSRRVARRLSARRILADLRAGRLGMEVPAPLSIPAPQLSEQITAPDGFACHAERSLGRQDMFVVAGQFSAPAAPATVPFHLETETGPSVLRTECPGPSGADVYPNLVEGQGGLMRGSLGVDALMVRQSAVTLHTSGSFTGLGYVGSRNGTLPITLTRLSERAATVTEPVEGP